MTVLRSLHYAEIRVRFSDSGCDMAPDLSRHLYGVIRAEVRAEGALP
jgi:hypothetical protein